MDHKQFLAHRAEDGREQSLQAHLEGTALLAGAFADAFGCKAWGELAGWSHDLGKYSQAFQGRIRGEPQRVDHSTAGSVELQRQKAIPAAFCVAGHHGGLPDGGNPKTDTGEDPTLYGRWQKPIPDYSSWREEIALPVTPALEGVSTPEEQAFFVRMLYSALVDADYLDTEAFMRAGEVERGGGASMAQLSERLDAYIAEKGFLQAAQEGSSQSVNRHRAEVLAACIEGAGQAPGLFSLTVPTGGGKTIASLAFALHHAVRHGLKRVIYVIPYCSIIDQTAGVFRSIVGEENVLEHHSGLVYDTGEDGCGGPEQTRLALATENWDAPIVVTTSVQFFESLYGNRSSQCRKLHHIAASVILMDEAQMMPYPCLVPCVSALGLLVKRYGATAVLCTATQPSLDGLFARLAPGLVRKELCPDTLALYQALRRVSFIHAGKLDNRQLAERLQRQPQVLCIVNSRKQAQEVYRLLEGEENIHLSTLMYPKHRARLIEEIRRRLKMGEPCRVVSTSLIEAGVDVDFPMVYRAEAGLDAIIQAGGRCNREGRRSMEDSQVVVFQPEAAAPPVMKANIAVAQLVMPLFSDLGAPEAIHAYFTNLMDLKGEKEMDAHGVMEAFRQGVEGRLLPFRTVAEAFQMIDSQTKTVYIPREEGEALVERLQAREEGRALFRKLGRYGVTVYGPHFQALLSAGDILPLGEDGAILSNRSLYSEKTGLSLVAEEGKALIID